MFVPIFDLRMPPTTTMRWLLRVAMCHIALGLSTWRSAPTRRVVLGTAGAALVRPPSAAWAAEDPAVAVGTVTMQAGVPDDSSRMALSADSALYVTVRVVPSNNVGKYVTEGKVNLIDCEISSCSAAEVRKG